MALNYVGVLISVASVVIFLFITPTLSKQAGPGKLAAGEGVDGDDADGSASEEGTIRVGLLKPGRGGGGDDDDDAAAAGGDGDGDMGGGWVDALSPATKRIVGVLMVRAPEKAHAAEVGAVSASRIALCCCLRGHSGSVWHHISHQL